MAETNPFAQAYYPQGGGPTQNPDQSSAFVSGLANQYNIGAGETDAANLAGKNPEDVAKFQQDLQAQYQRRATNNPGAPDAPAAGGGAAPPSGGAAPTDQWSGKANSLWDVLWGRASQDKVPNARDPIIAAQVGAYGATQQRGARDYINEMAERSGPTANLQGERRMAAEGASQATGALQSQVMQNELTARRQEIQNALSQMGGMLSDQERRALEAELGRGGLALNGELGRGNLALNQAQLGLQGADRANYWDALRSGLL